MKHFLLAASLALVVLTNIDCGKSSGKTGTSETPLTIELTPAAGTTQPPAPGPDFPLHIKITSAIPAAGVKITITAAPDGTSNYFFNQTIDNSSATDTDVVITGTPNNVICVVVVTVTSISDSNNKVTGSYRYSSK